MKCISWTCRHTSQFFRFFKAVTKKSRNESSTRSAVADFSLIDTCFKETKTSFRICERSKHRLKNLFLFFLLCNTIQSFFDTSQFYIIKWAKLCKRNFELLNRAQKSTSRYARTCFVQFTRQISLSYLSILPSS